jgi:hypothetical protein
MTQFLLIFCLFAGSILAVSAQTIKVNPTGVNVNAQNPSVVYLIFGQIPAGYVPAEAIWCGQLIPAPAPALGLQCDPGTIYGSLPLRYNLSTQSGNAGLTDIMAIPASVVRRAYQTAEEGGSAGFFYVRRFVSTTGQPDQFVNVTCRMSGGGARNPFSLTNVEIKTDSKEPVLFLKGGRPFPKTVAEIQYNGTGRLKGRWEIVQPGEEQPAEEDLLTEASLPLERRGAQRSYREIARFNHFLPPVGKFTLPLEIPENLPFVAEGQYVLLLRIEAVDDKEADSSLAAVGVGSGVVHSGAVAAFPMPTLKFFVGGVNPNEGWGETALLFPLEKSETNQSEPLIFSWKPLSEASVYQLEVFNEQEQRILSALLPASLTSYRAPSWLAQKKGGGELRWRVVGLDNSGKAIVQTNLRGFLWKPL